MADLINFQDKLNAKQSEQNAFELHMEYQTTRFVRLGRCRKRPNAVPSLTRGVQKPERGAVFGYGRGKTNRST